MRTRDIKTSTDVVIDKTGQYNYSFLNTEEIDINLRIFSNLEILFNFNFETFNKINFNVSIEDNSSVSFISLTKDQSDQNFVIDIKNDVTFTVNNLNIGNKSNLNLVANINGSNSFVKILNAHYGSDDNESRYDIKIYHNASNTNALVCSNVVLNDFAFCHMNIENNVTKDCKNINTYQKTKVLSLSDNVKAHVNPILNIDYFDIEGGHSLAFSKVSEDTLYYLMSRGINYDNSRMLIAKGFLMENYSDIKFDELLESRIKDGKLS